MIQASTGRLRLYGKAWATLGDPVSKKKKRMEGWEYFSGGQVGNGQGTGGGRVGDRQASRAAV